MVDSYALGVFWGFRQLWGVCLRGVYSALLHELGRSLGFQRPYSCRLCWVGRTSGAFTFTDIVREPALQGFRIYDTTNASPLWGSKD